jgi:RES domain-containing protein
LTLAVWRIAWNGALDLATIPDGSLLSDGRWHIAAHRLPIVYAGSTRALCQLEKRVHCNGFAPRNLALLRLELPDDSVLEEVALPANWKHEMTATQQLGVAWATSNRSLGMWIPSYVEPAERNLLINPRHPQYQAIDLHIEENPFVFDPRLFA